MIVDGEVSWIGRVNGETIPVFYFSLHRNRYACLSSSFTFSFCFQQIKTLAVRNFQAERGLAPDGIAGSATLNKMNYVTGWYVFGDNSGK